MGNKIYSLLLAFSIFHVCLSNSIDDHSEIINELKSIVASTIEQLKLYQNNFQSDVKINLQTVQNDSIWKINKDLNYVSSSIMNAVNAVGSTGKNAQSCYEACKVSLKNLNKQTNNKLDKCYYSFSYYTEPALKEIKTAIQNGENISEDLDTIFIGCTKHLTESGDCLTEKIEEVRKTLKKMQTNVNDIKNIGTSSMNKAKTVVTSCSEKAVRYLHVEATFNIQREANICVRNIYNEYNY
ncbi:uncharacterized protein LOC127287792 [Leptopilina boulardi]|uniref:uncharacterized protein LOC127287792 n=1 Tax=Leptopilina boulardi TaxID=63433 RepID=UPI0021F585D5|nr:uncharacterized protein LOC127287792 [Leptopilina boulardi]